MSKVKLMIEIDESDYEALRNDGVQSHIALADKIIANGTPLPEGHGRLIDADKLAPKIHGTKSIVAMLEAQTIVEADKESEK